MITDALEMAGADEADGDNALELSIHGLAYEYIYAKEGKTELTIKNISAESTFMVRDDSIVGKRTLCCLLLCEEGRFFAGAETLYGDCSHQKLQV